MTSPVGRPGALGTGDWAGPDRFVIERTSVRRPRDPAGARAVRGSLR
ncbi:MAG TPA: hypothetical protein VHO01_11265 [Jatrophihabitans sp.]|nr:hypothetical protein [Jatrophihabitans sp.]